MPAHLIGQVAAFALLALAPAEDPITIESPGSYPVTLAVIELGDGEFEGEYFPESDDPNTIYAGRGTAIVRNPARLIRRLAGAPMPGFKRVRRLHYGDWATKLRPVPRMVAVLESTDEGYYYVQWSQPLTGRYACFDAAMRAHFKMRFARPRTPNASGDICIDV